MKKIFAVALIVVFLISIAATAFATSHSAVYEWDGVVSLKKQAGHECNTGAAIKQTIMGSGTMSKTQTVSMGGGSITMSDRNDFVAGATPLTVTTVWELCTPAKHVYDIPGNYDAVAGVDLIFNRSGDSYQHPNDRLKNLGYEPISEQVWAVQVQADPGFSGNLHQSGKAVFASKDYLGQHNQTFKSGVDDGLWGDWDENDMSGRWGRFLDSRGNRVTLVGPTFGGDYFTMDQHVRTTQGTVKRFIDISSWRDHGYLMEDMSVVGKSDIKDVFNLTNLPAGADVPGDWWKLF